MACGHAPGQVLKATIERHNQFEATDVDLNFAKGSTQLNQYIGDLSNKPNLCIGPLTGKLYCAMAVWPAELGTSTGLETNQHWRVLNQQEMPIDGLYVCGNDMYSMIRGKYPGPGATSGHAIVFGYLAAFHAVTQK